MSTVTDALSRTVPAVFITVFQLGGALFFLARLDVRLAGILVFIMPRALAAESSSWAVRLHASHPVYVDRPSSEGPVAISIRCLHTYTKNRETPTCSTPVDMQPTTDSRNPSDACHSHLAHSRIRIDALMDCLSFLQSVVSSVPQG